MSKKDTITKQYLGQNPVFADAFNYYLFNGEQVIKPDDLKEQDSAEIAIIRKMGRAFPNQKFRDVLRLCTIRHNKYTTFVLLGIETQSDIHYAMPVRDYLYDALNYAAQVEAIRKSHIENKDLKDSGEFLSGFTKDDKLLPVITLCVCFDKTTWDAPRSLYEMFVKMDPRIKPYVNDYKLNLITPQEITDFSKFSSELGFVFEFIQKSDDKERLRDIIESKEAYHHIDATTVDLINTYTAANIPTEETEGETIDMCKAIQEMMEDSRQEERNAINTEITTLILWEEKCSTHSLFLPRCKEKAGNIPALDGPGSFDQPQLTLLLTLSKIYRKYQHLSMLTATVDRVNLP